MALFDDNVRTAWHRTAGSKTLRPFTAPPLKKLKPCPGDTEMIEKLESVALTEDLPEHGLQHGNVGIVVLVHGRGEAYEVEFVSLGGEQLALLTLDAGQGYHLPAR